jgi:hypothetical protein
VVPQVELKSPRSDAIRGTVEAFEYESDTWRYRDLRRDGMRVTRRT